MAIEDPPSQYQPEPSSIALPLSHLLVDIDLDHPQSPYPSLTSWSISTWTILSRLTPHSPLGQYRPGPSSIALPLTHLLVNIDLNHPQSFVIAIEDPPG